MTSTPFPTKGGGAADVDVWSAAQTEQRCLITQDLDSPTPASCSGHACGAYLVRLPDHEQWRVGDFLVAWEREHQRGDAITDMAVNLGDRRVLAQRRDDVERGHTRPVQAADFTSDFRSSRFVRRGRQVLPGRADFPIMRNTMVLGRHEPPDRDEPDVTSTKPATTHHDAELARILGEHAGALERVAASFTRTRADRDDLLQDFALALWRAFPTFRGECSERSFALRVAHNRALDFLARRKPVAEPLDDHEGSVAATSGKNPAIVYERKERGSELLAVVRALPLGHRQVVTLLLEGLSQREIAEVLGTTENVVNVRASRARTAMRALLEDDRRREETRR